MAESFSNSEPPSQPECLRYNLFVELKSCLNLPAKKQHGSSDPFVKFMVGNKQVHRTRTVVRELNPVWEDAFLVVLEDLDSPLEVKVYSHNLVKDDLLGQHTVDLTSLPLNTALTTSLPLSQAQPPPQVLLSLNLLQLPAEDSPSVHHSSHGRRNYGVLSLGLVEGRNFGDKMGDLEVHCKFRLGAESCRSKSVHWTNSPKWLEQLELPIQDVANLSDLEVKLKDFRARTLDKQTISLVQLEREKTQEVEMIFGGEEGRKLVLLLCITGTAEQARLHRTEIKLLDQFVGCLNLTVKKAQGLPKLSGVASSLHCVVELDNTRLQTQSVARSSNPVWNREFRVKVQDIHSCLGVSLMDRDRNMKTSLLGRLSLPLLSLGQGHSKTFLLKDKHLRQGAKGQRPELELEWRLEWDRVKAGLVTLTPRQEIVMNRAEKFKRRLLSDNMARVKSLAMTAEQLVVAVSRNIHWDSRQWVLRTYLLFLTTTYFFQLYMIPLSLAIILGINFYRQQQRETLSGAVMEGEMITYSCEDYEEILEKEKDDNVSLNKIMQIVQDAFPMIQNCLGLVASSAEKLKNTFNWSVPFLSVIAMISFLLISLILFLVDLRTLIIIVGSVKFIKNLIVPGWVSNNELLDFLSRVPDDRQLQETKEIPR